MLPRNKKLKERAKELRKNMTPQERRLWYDFLRDYPVKVYKQKIVGNYIADFYCDSAKLVIELEGLQHSQKDNQEYDKLRTEYFNSMGITVIRFTNKECDDNFEGVCSKIDNVIKRKLE